MARGRGGFIGQDGLNAPDSPTAVSASAGNAQASVAFTAPSDVGGSAITGFRVQDGTNVHGASGSSSPITVTGLTNGTAYTFNVWAINAFGYSAPSDASTGVTPANLGRAIFGGGSEYGATVEYVEIASLSNSIDFGDLASPTTGTAACSSSTRGVFGGGYAGGNLNVMQYFTIASTGNSTDFGDTVSSLTELTGLANSTRGLYLGGSN